MNAQTIAGSIVAGIALAMAVPASLHFNGGLMWAAATVGLLGALLALVGSRSRQKDDEARASANNEAPLSHAHVP